MAHSKRNTSLAFFTAHERAELKSSWGTRSTRLHRDSFLPFASCNLCLQPSRDPVACASHGDIFCRECIVSNLLAQRKEIKRLEKDDERRRREGEEQNREKAEEERERSVRDFEKTMMGMEGTARKTNGNAATHDPRDSEGRGVKRKFELDAEEVLKNTKEERAKARKAIEDEKAAKPTLPAFWVPSLTPSTDSGKLSSASLKLSPICPGSSPTATHPLSLKTLVTISFSQNSENPKTSTSSSTLACPACNKTLSNASKAMLTIPCGHVLCKPCATKFMTPSAKLPDPHADTEDEEKVRCYVCETDLTPEKAVEEEVGAKKKKHKKGGKEDKDRNEKGLVELRSEGTGFAGGGKNTVKREGGPEVSQVTHGMRWRGDYEARLWHFAYHSASGPIPHAEMA
ncbi:MAG: hypothetical protein Q9228_003493 [Teloschistes exilis]